MLHLRLTVLDLGWAQIEICSLYPTVLYVVIPLSLMAAKKTDAED